MNIKENHTDYVPLYGTRGPAEEKYTSQISPEYATGVEGGNGRKERDMVFCVHLR